MDAEKACDRATRLLLDVSAGPADDTLPALSDALREALLGEPEADAEVDPRAALLEHTAAALLGPGWRDGALVESDDALLRSLAFEARARSDTLFFLSLTLSRCLLS